MKRVEQILLVVLACITLPASAMAVEINAGMNDTWKDPATPKQGFFITVFPDTPPGRPEPLLFLAWFTYDVERPPANVTAIMGDPGARWLTALGSYSGDTATLDVEITQGGIFDSGVPVPDQTPGYGTITVKFTSCSQGTVTYDIPPVGVSGVIPIIRAAPDNEVVCTALQPQ
ncbi:MAG: hypothetical protein EXR85_08540 [Xanthomonadales bacterium]|nr:hypothetical protein [Xanthomonadales bacterium]